ncbi:flagellar basal body L-ring protein FlgH [Thermopetrobacter sp. TC1]|uniref:flagellar basal body L-ring protein FlgH n=1 Tax=Thermopetrobacter sp. TC1 TaxID=1495045 RepID=UPI000690C863|nr:flagellar basal body L-ring protein FlgH [Thermopetrobacter sp. TC1]
MPYCAINAGIRPFAALALGALLSACTANLEDIGKAPDLSPIGTGMTASIGPVVAPPKPQPQPAHYSLWPEGKESMFHDQRARNAGDVVTVLIQIDDWAKLDNMTSREKSSDMNGKLGMDFSYSTEATDTPKFETKSSLSGTGSLGTGSKFKGKGGVARSEKIKLAIAATIIRVLPNGNFVISGQQEVRVNHELRVLRISGIVRPEDITQENTVSYDKIAEARISYGGRGRITEVQQPGWGQQLIDMFNPF